MKNSQKAALLSSLGAGLEYYDFIIYGMMAEYLGTLFFSSDKTSVALIKTFAIFAIGYLARPIGGIFFGFLGDVFGRKVTFLSVMLLMALSTLGIGLLPVYSQVGILAPILLVFFRLLQGISFGAELPGAITVVCEYAEENQDGKYSGFVIASTSLGAMLASLILYLLTAHFSNEQILNGGWRWPFIFGGTLAVISYFIRKYLKETPAFSNLKQSLNCQSDSIAYNPIKILVKNYKLEIAKGVGLSVFISSLVIVALYFQTFLKSFQFSSENIYLATFLSLLWSALILPFCGRLSDSIGKKTLYILTCLVFILSIFPMFALLNLGQFKYLCFFLIFYQTVIALISTCYFPLLTSLFPTHVRFTGVAACYNISYSFISTLPFFLTILINWTSPSILIWVLILFAFIASLACQSILKKQNLKIKNI